MEYWPIFPLILGGMFTLVEGVMFWLGQPRWIHRLGLVARAGSERLAFAVPSVGQVTRLGDEEVRVRPLSDRVIAFHGVTSANRGMTTTVAGGGAIGFSAPWLVSGLIEVQGVPEGTLFQWRLIVRLSPLVGVAAFLAAALLFACSAPSDARPWLIIGGLAPAALYAWLIPRALRHAEASYHVITGALSQARSGNAD